MSPKPDPPVRQEDIEVPRNETAPDRVVISAESFSGPLPLPEVLGRYEAICRGSADRIIRVAEQEAEHRRSLEQAVVRSEMEQEERRSHERKRGQLCALIITLSAIAAGSYTAIHGQEIAGSIIGVGGIGSIVTTFLIGNKKKEPAPEDEQKQKPTTS